LIPILVIAVGVTWLLNVLEILPGVDWIWIGGLALAGILTLATGGFNKLTVVIGPFLLIASLCSLLRQVGKMPLDREVPILTIVLGGLMFLVQLLKLDAPEFLKNDEPDSAK
jgi:hypothetical protein